MKINNIENSYDYIYSFINLETKLDLKYKLTSSYNLENITKLLELFNNPHLKQKIIHIAGTKGKGSVTMMTSKLINIAGYSTCSFLSPHLIKPNERILYNLTPISDEDFIKYTNLIKNTIEKHNLIPTTFELFFIMYLLYAKDKKADYLVIEVGMGGRLDCTNIVTPVISIITTIGYDHTDILGKKLSQIAYEKAGIIKDNIPVITANQKIAAYNIIKKTAKNKNSKIIMSNKYFKKIKISPIISGLSVDFNYKNHIIKNFMINLFGEHQVFNFFSSFLAVNYIFPDFINKITNNFNFDLIIPGRIQVLNNNKKLIILDTAHNKDSSIILKKALKFHFKNTKWTILTGMSYDKDYKTFYKGLFDIANKIIITTPSEYKKSNPEIIYEWMKKIFKNVLYIPDFKEAFKISLSNDLPLLITGSFYIAGPFLELYNKINHE